MPTHHHLTRLLVFGYTRGLRQSSPFCSALNAEGYTVRARERCAANPTCRHRWRCKAEQGKLRTETKHEESSLKDIELSMAQDLAQSWWDSMIGRGIEPQGSSGVRMRRWCPDWGKAWLRPVKHVFMALYEFGCVNSLRVFSGLEGLGLGNTIVGRSRCKPRKHGACISIRGHMSPRG